MAKYESQFLFFVVATQRMTTSQGFSKDIIIIFTPKTFIPNFLKLIKASLVPRIFFLKTRFSKKKETCLGKTFSRKFRVEMHVENFVFYSRETLKLIGRKFESPTYVERPRRARKSRKKGLASHQSKHVEREEEGGLIFLLLLSVSIQRARVMLRNSFPLLLQIYQG